MRDKTANPQFILQKKIEQWFYKLHPDKWIPLYDMVTYRPDIRYSEALQRGYYQDQLCKKYYTFQILKKIGQLQW